MAMPKVRFKIFQPFSYVANINFIIHFALHGKYLYVLSLIFLNVFLMRISFYLLYIREEVLQREFCHILSMLFMKTKTVLSIRKSS